MKFEPDIKTDDKNHCKQDVYVKRRLCKSFSLYYNDLARWLFITLTFSGILSTGWFGIPLAPNYLLHHSLDLMSSLFALFSSLGSIWGIMAYREFTRSSERVKAARDLARQLDPLIGEYEYRSYNHESKLYELGYVPHGPVDFWDKEIQVPSWLDKGKYWHILLGLQTANKEIMLEVVRDVDLPFASGRQNAAITCRELLLSDRTSKRRLSKRYRYRVKIPQWLVMNTERIRFVERKEILKLDYIGLISVITELNKKLVLASDEIIEREKSRIQYPWKITALGIYLNKSLPLRIIYREVLRHFPGSHKHIIEDANANLANIKDNDLITAIIEIAIQKGLSTNKIDKIASLMRFLKNAYAKQGLGEGSSEYHNFHHSLEVAYMSLHMLLKEFRGYKFTSKDYELILIAGLLHDYDPSQIYLSSKSNNERNPRGPKVNKTISEIEKTRIHDAYFTMNEIEFQNYFREYKSSLLPPIEFATTHPEYVKVDRQSVESIIVEALIWHTDFPYFKQNLAQEMFSQLIRQLDYQGQDSGKIKMLGEILWLADLAVTYMGSDPIRAWDRVGNLYDELYLPKFEAVSRTDAFFSDFAETDIFKDLINKRQFPDIFRQRWNLVYQFFHEGNPSTHLNRTIMKAKNLYLRVNVEIGMRSGEMLQKIASNNWADYFIGIGKDQRKVLQAKSRFTDLDPPNASAFWGDIRKLLPNIPDNSINNFIMVLPQKFALISTEEEKLLCKSLLTIMLTKLYTTGALQLLTDLKRDSVAFKELIEITFSAGFDIDSGNVGKVYLSKDWVDADFIKEQKPEVLVFVCKKNSKDR